MNIYSLIEYLEKEIKDAAVVPFSGKKVGVDRDQMLSIIDEIRNQLPAEIKEAESIMAQSEAIVAQAQKEAEIVSSEAENLRNSLVNDHEVTQLAYKQAQDIMMNAQQNAREIRLGANAYAEDVLTEIEGYLRGQLDEILKNRQELQQMSPK